MQVKLCTSDATSHTLNIKPELMEGLIQSKTKQYTSVHTQTRQLALSWFHDMVTLIYWRFSLRLGKVATYKTLTLGEG